jgi:hypothetical protein
MLFPVARRFGIPGIVVVVAIFLIGRYVCEPDTPQRGVVGGEQSEQVQFVSFVLDDAQSTWSRTFAEHGRAYQPARMVVFQGSTPTGCGYGAAAVGPFYCPLDKTVYIDLTFYRELKERFGAPGDFAQAYVIAHEIGHHVQNQLGLLEAPSSRGPQSVAVRQELQADCLAGMWAHSTGKRDLLEPGDVEEAIGAASAIGDDALQRSAEGTVRPESWTHGSSQQRVAAFRRGLERGKLEDCGAGQPGA